MQVRIVEFLHSGFKGAGFDNGVSGNQLYLGVAACCHDFEVLVGRSIGNDDACSRHVKLFPCVSRSICSIGRVPREADGLRDIDAVGHGTVGTFGLDRCCHAVAGNKVRCLAIDLRRRRHAKEVVDTLGRHFAGGNPLDCVIQRAGRELDLLAHKGIGELKGSGLGIDAVSNLCPCRAVLACIPSKRKIGILGQIGRRPVGRAGNLDARRECDARGERHV